MAMLGDLIAQARKSSPEFQSWLKARDPEMSLAVAQLAAQTGDTPTGFVRAAIADFARFASEEDWATLVSRLRSSEDPGTICLLAMVEWRLAAARPTDPDPTMA